jgi:predicted O-methyltransferase YrrM
MAASWLWRRKKYKADATGIEFDPTLVKQSTALIKRWNLSPLAKIIEGDLLNQDYSSADLLTVCLLPIANEKLIPMFEKQLKHGARVVSHNAPFGPWTAEKTETIDDDGQGRSHRLYLYRR